MDIALQKPSRDEFGALITLPEHLRSNSSELLTKAVKSGKLDATYYKMEPHKKYGYLGWCLNYDYYDVSPSAVLVQRRETERNKYGTTPHKSYYLIERVGRGVRVTEAPKARVAKLAKSSTEFGQVISTLTAPSKGYKIVEERDGDFYSVFQPDFAWKIGKRRTEPATPNHEGGYYVFPTQGAALKAFAEHRVFADAWTEGKRMVLVECECSGLRHTHDSRKLCVSTCKLIAVIRHLMLE